MKRDIHTQILEVRREVEKNSQEIKEALARNKEAWKRLRASAEELAKVCAEANQKAKRKRMAIPIIDLSHRNRVVDSEQLN